MKQLLLATAAVVGLSSAALAAEPVALIDSQLDEVTAGQTVNALLLPVALGNFGVFAPNAGTFGSGFATDINITTVSVP